MTRMKGLPTAIAFRILLATAALVAYSAAPTAIEEAGCKKCNFCWVGEDLVHCCWTQQSTGSNDCSPAPGSCTESGGSCGGA